MYVCESCTIKNAEQQRIDAFELWCLRRLLRVPWTARRSNQSILNETSPDIHWKDWGWNWNSSTLATWCEELTHWKRPWYWESLKMGGEGDDRVWDGWMASPMQWTWVWASFWRRKWLPTPVFLPGKSHGQKNLVGNSPCDHKESEMTEWLHFRSFFLCFFQELVMEREACCPAIHGSQRVRHDGATEPC